jgi:hypothetical protein
VWCAITAILIVGSIFFEEINSEQYVSDILQLCFESTAEEEIKIKIFVWA